MGTGCPNILPQITWNTPVNTTINQNSGFEAIPIQVTVTDSDGSINSVNIMIDGATMAMVSEGGGMYSYKFTPGAHKKYPVVITAVDNESGSKILNETLNITNSQFVPLPEKVNVGYVHSWNADNHG